MADYVSMCRTNYFKVTDEERLKEIIGSCVAECDVKLSGDSSDNTFAFYCEGNLLGLGENNADEDYGEMRDCLIQELQKILPEGEAILLMEIGNEKVRYLVGTYTVITRYEMKFIDLRDVALQTVRDMLKNPEFETQLEY